MVKKMLKKKGNNKVKEIKERIKKNSLKIQEIEHINGLKLSYEALINKYSLPSYIKLNDEFDIGKVEVNPDSVLREIRKAMISKFFSILNFIELLINPSSGSMFYLYLVRGLDNGDKEKLKMLFDKLGSIEIDSFYLDINYSQDAEANFIKEKTKMWDEEIKPVLSEILEKLNLNWKKISLKKEKSYFG